MALLEIGLKVSTLPVAALGVGIGVDYGIYLYGRFREFYGNGDGLRESYAKALEVTGNGVLFTGLTLAIGVSTWLFSPLKFQADMGVLLAFLFLTNMLGALVLLPALLRLLLGRDREQHAPEPAPAAASAAL
jgi:predicted RND superfamily exporter protein